MAKKQRLNLGLSKDAFWKLDMLARISGDRFRWGENGSPTKVAAHILEQIGKLPLNDLQKLVDNNFKGIKFLTENKK